MQLGNMNRYLARSEFIAPTQALNSWKIIIFIVAYFYESWRGKKYYTWAAATRELGLNMGPWAMSQFTNRRTGRQRLTQWPWCHTCLREPPRFAFKDSRSVGEHDSNIL